MSTDDQEIDPPSSGRKKRRSYKNLPRELQDVDRNDVSSFVCALELDNATDKEQLRAQKMIKNGVEISLSNLNVDQLRLLCRRIGITGATSAKRDACRALIANLHTINAAAKSRNDDPRSVEQTATNTLLRQVNVIFSSEFVDRLQELNDGKTRVDHETGNIAKNFWSDVTMAFNDVDAVEDSTHFVQPPQRLQFWEDIKQIVIDTSSPQKIQDTTSNLMDAVDMDVNLPMDNPMRAIGEILLLHALEGSESVVRKIVAKFGWRSNIPPLDPVATMEETNTATVPFYFDEKLVIVNHQNDPILQDMIDEKTIDLSDVDVMTEAVYQKRVNLLFRIRRQMKDNMTKSGTHDSDPWNFIDVAMNKVPGGRRLSKVGVLYFYRRCEEFPDVDASFQTFLDDGLKGSTVDDPETESTTRSNDFRGHEEVQERFTKKAREEKQRMDAYASVIDMCKLTSKLYEEFHESNKIKKDKVQLEKLKVQIELAKTLGDQDRLRHLALELQKLYE